MEHKRKEKDKEDKGGPTGWYNHVVGGSIPPVPTIVEKESRQADEKGSEEKRWEEKTTEIERCERQDKKRREDVKVRKGL
jgi:hypothetical protein